jgi:hypothetical protein
VTGFVDLSRAVVVVTGAGSGIGRVSPMRSPRTVPGTDRTGAGEVRERARYVDA